MLSHSLRLFFTAFLFLSFITGSVNAQTVSPYSLEIIQPLAGLDTKNRFYKAYPGIEYNVSAAVIGGAYPYSYALTSAPSGMTVNASTGEIKWPSPTASSTAYSATLTVTDANGTTQKVTWPITVTTSGFAFVDATNGSDSNDGSISAPWKTFAKVYGGTDYASKYATANQNKFIYFKAGTYLINGYTGGATYVQYTSNQPAVLLAYPGTKPVLDFDKNYLRFDSATNNFYVDGFDVANVNQVPGSSNIDGEYYFAFRLVGSSNNMTFRRNKFHGLNGTNGGSNNQSFIMLSAGDSKGQRSAILENEFTDVQTGYGVIGYTTTKMLVANNTLHNFTGNVHPIGPKDSCDHWTIRNNKIYDVDDKGIWLYGTVDHGSYGDMEVSYNYVQSRGAALEVFGGMLSTTGPAYVFRNTFVGTVDILMNLKASLTYNVIVNSTSTASKITTASSASNITMANNLLSASASSIIDSAGKLVGSYTSYVGTTGWETGTVQAKPMSPTISNITVEAN